MDLARFPLMRDNFDLTAICFRASLVSAGLSKLHLSKWDWYPRNGYIAGRSEAEDEAHPRPWILVGSCISTQS